MPIDFARETLIPFHEAPKHIPGRPHISTLHRWRLKGCRGRRLETGLFGGRRFTSLEAIQRFFQSDDAPDGGSPPPSADDREFHRRADAAGQELERRGI
jgi:hypothetical protein